MKQLMESYYTHLRERLMRPDSACPPMSHWQEFLFFLLGYSIPHQFSACVTVLNMGKTPASEISDASSCSNAVLPFYDFRIQGETAQESCPIALAIQRLLECIQREIRRKS
jgi:hypothetical protein